MSDVLNVLVKARAEVEKGWCKNTLEDDDGNVCAIGALNRAITGDALNLFSGESDGQRAYASLSAVIRDSEYPGWGVASWNNDPRVAKDDVLAAFDRALASIAVEATSDPAHVHTLA